MCSRSRANASKKRPGPSVKFHERAPGVPRRERVGEPGQRVRPDADGEQRVLALQAAQRAVADARAPQRAAEVAQLHGQHGLVRVGHEGGDRQPGSPGP
jgi:hypothetical protein